MNWEKLEEDSKMTEEWLGYLAEKQDENYQIKDPDYLNPDMWKEEEPLPMNHILGAFMYFRKIKGILKKAKETGSLSEDELPENAPKYLEELVR
ncbi:MAG: hypothetical protein Q8P79_02180 [Nanoarchaeota archaeon]|nr:hypothetical protein [Nanoarchaeota archaeon]